MRSPQFTADAFKDFTDWKKDKKVFEKLSKLIIECCRHPETGTGDPEQLKHNFAGYWSRRITKEHRLVYSFDNEVVKIYQVRYHYK